MLPFVAFSLVAAGAFFQAYFPPIQKLSGQIKIIVGAALDVTASHQNAAATE